MKKRLFSLFLAVVLIASLVFPAFADDAYCPKCGGEMLEYVASSFGSSGTVCHTYTCSVCSYMTSLLYDDNGILTDSTGWVPKFSNGNATYTIPASNYNNMSGGGTFTSAGVGRINSSGSCVLSLSYSDLSSLSSSYYYSPATSTYSLDVDFIKNVFPYSSTTSNFIFSASYSNSSFTFLITPKSGNSTFNFLKFYLDAKFIAPVSGYYNVPAFSTSCSNSSISVSSKSNIVNCFYTAGSTVSIPLSTYSSSSTNLSFLSLTYTLPTITYTPLSTIVNSCSSINVNGDVVTGDKIYNYENNYYVYTTNEDNSEQLTVYYTDSSGNIAGDVTYDNSTNVYYYTVYNVTPPATSTSTSDTSTSPSGSSAGAGGASAGADTDSTASDGSSSGLFGAIGDFLGAIGGGLFDVVGSALTKILEVLTSLVGSVVDSIKTLFDSILDSLTSLLDFNTGFTDFLQQFFYWLPSEVVAVLVVAVSLGIVLAIIKFLKGFF